MEAKIFNQIPILKSYNNVPRFLARFFSITVICSASFFKAKKHQHLLFYLSCLWAKWLAAN